MASASVNVGQEFVGRSKNMSWERLWTFSGGAFSHTGWPKKNIHTDLDYARECGLESAVASATQIEGYIVQLLVDVVGVNFLSHGTMEVKFVGRVSMGDTVVPKIVVKSKELHNGAVTLILDVWVENQRGERVVVGSATFV